jgi:hypothetical protein
VVKYTVKHKEGERERERGIWWWGADVRVFGKKRKERDERERLAIFVLWVFTLRLAIF